MPYVPPGVLTSVSPAGVSAAGLATRPVDLMPLPGSLEDQLDREYAARAGFRYCVWNGTTITGLPNNLLWEPPFAIKREPRMLVLPTSLDNFAETWTLDTSIGTTVGLWRFEPVGRDAAYQVDVFGVVHSRLTPDDLVASDYRFGIPLTARRGPWHFKFAYEHTSSHLGDDFIRNRPPFPLGEYIRDEAVFGVGRWFAERLRVYGQVAYAFDMTYPQPVVDDDVRWRFDAGFEWYCPQPTGWKGTPFVALNIDSRGDSDFQHGRDRPGRVAVAQPVPAAGQRPAVRRVHQLAVAVRPVLPRPRGLLRGRPVLRLLMSWPHDSRGQVGLPCRTTHLPAGWRSPAPAG